MHKLNEQMSDILEHSDSMTQISFDHTLQNSQETLKNFTKQLRKTEVRQT